MLPETFKQMLPARPLLVAKALRHYWYGEPEVRLLKTLVDPARDSLDIGAAEGVYMYFLTRLSKHVDAYEPNPRFYAFLTAAALPNATVHCVAASDRDGKATLSIPMIGQRRMHWRGTLTNHYPLGNCARVNLQTRRLDNMGHTNIGFMKIDVEGHEESVLRGAAELIERCAPTLLVEIEQRYIDSDINKVFALLESMGYAGFFLMDRTLHELERFDVEEHQHKYVSNRRSQPPYINNFIFRPKR